jgi:Cytosol aminopeptidase family, N-terminal domain
MTEIDGTVIESKATLQRRSRKSTSSLILQCGLMLFCAISIASAQTSPNQAHALATGQMLHVQQSGFPVDVLVQGPADTETELQIICLFHSEPSNTLHGSLIEMNQKLQGLLDRVRTPSLFTGELGETLVAMPHRGTIPAQRLLIIGLGDSRSFTPARMNLIGTIAFNEASRLGVKHPFFAPTVLDGGVSGFNTGEVAEQFMRGFLRARELETQLHTLGEAPPTSVEGLTFLAGAAHAAETQSGLAKAFIPVEPR